MSNSYYASHRDDQRAKMKVYREANGAKIKAKQKLWYESNKAKVLARVKKRSDEKKPQIVEYKKAYQKKNKLRIKAKARAWRLANVDAIREKDRIRSIKDPSRMRRHHLKRRAIKKGANIGDTAIISAWEKKWHTKVFVACYWCKQPTRVTDCHTDHIVPLSKGGLHSVENLCISCGSCNLSKGSSDPNEWNQQLKEPVLL